uniref:ABC transporter domain-containing protein n=1 Tax=Musa acuminata subsp. malaccensis TaxID=214687 RepID=A0A804JZP3_MUSAM|nr:PREDICTED: ABC transporter A family member 7-like [Musa acuminata subsp. malaccensis]
MESISSAASSSRRPASFFTQANALLRKNLTFQKRNLKTNIGIVAFPIFICVLIVLIQQVINNELNKDKFQCGCQGGDCGLQYSTLDQVDTCPISSPPEWSALIQVPRPQYRAVRTDFSQSADLPDESCRASQSCPAAVLLTGGNRSLAQSLAQSLFLSSSSALNFSDYPSSLSNVILGTDTPTENTQFIEPAFVSDRPFYVVQPQCTTNATSPISFKNANISIELGLECVQGLTLWRDNSSLINDELFKGYRQGNSERKANEFIAAYDFLNSDENGFNLNIWYNSTYNNDTGFVEVALVRVPRTVNAASNAYLKFRKGAGAMVMFDFVKEMPKTGTDRRFDFSSLLGPLFFTWIIELLFPVILTYVVYERQQKLRIMMKMHGLKDGPYWFISYIYFFSLSSVYMICFVIFGSIIGLKFFRLNDYSIQVVFYFIYINLQIALAFLIAPFFSAVKTATVFGYNYVFGSGLLGEFLLRFFIEDTSFPRGWILVMELVPGFSLYRGLFEFSQYSFSGDSMGTSGMKWGDLDDSQNGMKAVLIIMFVEWLVLLVVAFYLDQLIGGGIRKDPFFFLRYFQKKSSVSQRKPSFQRQGSKVFVEMERPDVSQEREVVEQLLLESSFSHAVISDNLKKVYPGRDGNPDKLAVRGLSLALPNGECFGMLGPNGAGKTTFINMMIGLITPTSGTAYVQGVDIRTNMDEIYTSMGVCPQHDLLWETLTGREHLLFYGRLKNLKGAALLQAVDESLKSVNLFYGGVGDKQAGKYSGGMKRRLSVAISLIGDPKVVYMDEPSTGLDPASRNNLWNVVKNAKRDRAIILTTHSMEEAEVLCDRLGIFVDGGFQCIGNPKELKARYGGSYVFTMTTSVNEEEEVESLVRQLSPSANKIYHISGTQKFELPKQEVRIADVFRAVEIAKSKFTIHAWGLADTTLEDVFIKVAKGAQSLNVLS